MEFTLALKMGGKKGASKRTHAITVPDVMSLEQVKEVLDKEFGPYFQGVTTLEEAVKPKEKKESKSERRAREIN